MSIIWHRPTEIEIKARWHGYDTRDGQSLCRKYGLVGIGRPKGATEKVPKAHRCGVCWRTYNRLMKETS